MATDSFKSYAVVVQAGKVIGQRPDERITLYTDKAHQTFLIGGLEVEHLLAISINHHNHLNFLSLLVSPIPSGKHLGNCETICHRRKHISLVTCRIYPRDIFSTSSTSFMEQMSFNRIAPHAGIAQSTFLAKASAAEGLLHGRSPSEVLAILIQSIFIPPTAKINCTRPRDAWFKCGNAQEKADTLKGFLCPDVGQTCGTEFISKYQSDQVSILAQT